MRACGSRQTHVCFGPACSARGLVGLVFFHIVNNLGFPHKEGTAQLQNPSRRKRYGGEKNRFAGGASSEAVRRERHKENAINMFRPESME